MTEGTFRMAVVALGAGLLMTLGWANRYDVQMGPGIIILDRWGKTIELLDYRNGEWKSYDLPK